MALKEYRFNGRTYAFDEDNVPDGAELVGDYVVVSPILFPDQTASKPTKPEVEEKAETATPANKAGRKPANKSKDHGDSAE